MTFEQFLLPTPKHTRGLHVLQKTAMLLMSVMVVFSLVGVNFHVMLWQTSEWLVGAVLPGAQIFSTNIAPSEGVSAQAAIGTLSGSTATKALPTQEAVSIKSSTFQFTYALVGATVFVLLMLSVAISSYYSRPLQVAYGLVLLFIMTGLFYVQVEIGSSTLATLLGVNELG